LSEFGIEANVIADERQHDGDKLLLLVFEIFKA